MDKKEGESVCSDKICGLSGWLPQHLPEQEVREQLQLTRVSHFSGSMYLVEVWLEYFDQNYGPTQIF
jgi:hypothetical protein